MNALAVAAAIALAGCSPVVGRAPALDASIVVVMQDGFPVCSGFAIGESIVLTAAHCLRDDATPAVVTSRQWLTQTQSSTEAEVVSVDLARDLAVLSVDHSFADPLRQRAPITGEQVFARSLKFGGIEYGNVLAGAGYFRDTTLSIRLGWSGSPVLGHDGRVVGVVHSCLVPNASPHSCLAHSTQITVLP